MPLKYFILSLCAVIAASAAANSTDEAVPKWNEKAAAQYLDQRAGWWETWPAAKRDHETVCVSCHTMIPYALSRPKLSSSLNESQVPAPETSMLTYLKKRVSMWSEVEPYYLDSSAGPGKSRESRATESVLNALVLASTQNGQVKMDPLTHKAFDAAWALQLKSGEHAGAWDWQVFHLAPWESTDSQYQGATFMALALGWTPDRYKHDSSIQPHVKLLKSYLRREYGSQTLLNQVVLLWASARVPGLLSNKEKHRLVDTVLQQQQSDGGWNLATLGSWVRQDKTPQEKESDGYATGIVTLALKQANIRSGADACVRGRSWLESHQNSENGSWAAFSVNKKRDPKSDVGRFMTDAATGYAVLALEATRH